eukprot:m.15115 g.15115  ORF g.15115 m.15115 type:complete len:222 (-) comp10447_c0_seq2:128-793(-)
MSKSQRIDPVAAQAHVDMTIERVMQHNYASRIFLALCLSLGPERYVDILQKFLESLAILSAFVGAFSGILEADYYDDSLASNCHLGLTTLTQLFALFTTMISVLLYVQIGFYCTEEITYFTSRHGTFLALPIVGLILSLVLASASIMVRIHIMTEDKLLVYISVAIGVVLTVLACAMYMYLDHDMRAVRLRALTHMDDTPKKHDTEANVQSTDASYGFSHE